MTTDCAECQIAAVRLWSGFRFQCQGCAARAVARSPQFHRARESGKQDGQYRSLLEQFGLTHAEVLAAAEKDFEGRRKQCETRET